MKLEDLNWLVGDWVADIWGGRFQESWRPPSDGTMQGLGKHVKDGRTGFVEFFLLDEEDDGVTMWLLLGSPAQKEPRRVAFPLTSSSEGEAVFENPENDGPTKITYRLKKGGITCSLEGKDRKEEFDFRPAGVRTLVS